MEFGDYYWHDAEIRNIEIDRSNPGYNDVISFDIIWPDIGHGKLIFEDVYWSRLNLNFGIIALECIDYANITESIDQDLVSFYKSFGSLIADINLTCYAIKTRSTASEIKIIAKRFKVLQ